MENRILKLEDMKNKSIDEITTLYKEGYILEDVREQYQLQNLQEFTSVDVLDVIIGLGIGIFIGSWLSDKELKKKLKKEIRIKCGTMCLDKLENIDWLDIIYQKTNIIIFIKKIA